MIGTKSYSWTTPRGVKVEATFTVKHITSHTVWSDGWEVETKCQEWHYQCDALTINGKQTKYREWYSEKGIPCVLFDRIGKDRMLVAIPDKIYQELTAEEREYNRIKSERIEKTMEAYESHRRSVEKMMNM